MKKMFSRPLLIVLGTALMLPVALLAQKEDKDKEKDKSKDESQQIIINRNTNKNQKIVVEVNGDKVTVNGKPIDDYKGDDVIVRKTRTRGTYGYSYNNGANSWTTTDGEPFKYLTADSNRAMLGVTTDEVDKGVEVQSVSKESAAAKAGLKEGDVIVKVDDKKISNPDELTKVIRAHKAGDKVTVTYLRDDKEQKATAELGKLKGSNVYMFSPKMDLGDMNFNYTMPKMAMPRSGMAWSTGGGPKLGLSVQDTDDGKGVKVLDVDDESNAQKAGIKEDDIITEVDGKAVNSADEVAKIIKDSKDKNSVMLKLTRSGKTQNIEVKIPRKLKTADL